MSVAQVFSGFMSKQWVSPGPTIDMLIASTIMRPDKPTERRVRSLTGPLGGGKSTGVLGATLVNAMQQPIGQDGIRRYRVLVLRDTYANAWSQFVPFFEEWFPRTMPGVTYAGSTGGPLDVTLHLMTPAGPVDYVLQLRALGEHRGEMEIENFLRGLPVTDIWLEEGDILPESVYRKGFTRLGRFPSRSTDGIGARCPTLWISSNQYLIGSWPYALKMSGAWRPGIELFEQPGGRSPKAENLHNLSDGYYEAIVERSDERTVRRQVDNEHVLPNAGRPVYPEFRDLLHTGVVTLDPRLPLRIGLDGGLATLNPAASLGQRAAMRQLRIKSEVCVDHGTDAEGFSALINRELGKPIYLPWASSRKDIIVTVDPSAQWGSAPGKPNWIMAVQSRTGLIIKPARTNDLAPRRQALRQTMSGPPDSQLLVDRDGAPNLRMALGGLFHFPKIRAGLATRDSDTPAKNHPYSDVVESTEYLAMDDQAYGEFEGRKIGAASTGPRQLVAQTD